MGFNLKVVVAAVALAMTGAASAAITNMDTGDSSLVFFAADNTGSAKGSVVIDLGKKFTDFLNGTGFTTNVTGPLEVKWNFVTNTLTINGVQQGGTFNWSTPFSDFTTKTQATEVRWGLFAGNSGLTSTNQFLATGNPTASQLSQQIGGFTDSMSTPGRNLITFNNLATSGNSTLASAGSGANSAGGTASADGFVPAVFGSTFNWGTNLKWNSAVAEGNLRTLSGTTWGSGTNLSQLTFLDGAVDGGTRVAGGVYDGKFAFDGTTLQWTVSAVPEPGTYALMLAGLGVIGLIARRRRVV